ncbi:hypothetical protein KQX54_007826 [Cotesia glomerata]|uniref:Uncharacterized protein n=1 Tax=Cotesia glomerata TaxID=32391 RepID=A0AAV7I1S7_COTGL|nr:hypothetical protein KQX54_007826 [Cotesia glomerata]
MAVYGAFNQGSSPLWVCGSKPELRVCASECSKGKGWLVGWLAGWLVGWLPHCQPELAPVESGAKPSYHHHYYQPTTTTTTSITRTITTTTSLLIASPSVLVMPVHWYMMHTGLSEALSVWGEIEEGSDGYIYLRWLVNITKPMNMRMWFLVKPKASFDWASHSRC